MIKINPIKNNIIYDIKSLRKNIRISPYKTASIAAAMSCPVVLSTKCSDFDKTINEDNYFQLKINPETGYPFEADIFQKTSANHLFNGDDVVVTAPTGTGKTAIAEYIMTKNLKEGKKTYYTTPLKALSNEKFRDFSKTYGEKNVGLLTGDTKINKDAPIVIMTTEVYRNMAVADQFSEHKHIPEDLKTVIFDELQYLGDIDRGGIWEQSIMYTPKNIQMLSLSATAKNAERISQWMAHIKGLPFEKAETNANFKTASVKKSVWVDVPAANRHVPLEIQIKETSPEMKKTKSSNKYKIKEKKKEALKKAKTVYAKPSDESYLELTRKLQQENKLPAIYFVFSKKEGRNLLKYLALSNKLTTKEEENEIKQIIKKYNDSDKYLGVRLNTDALTKGYAIHNAGLLPSQKELVEELFQKKLVKVAIATETLSAGINMPARTTVISSPRKPASSSDGGEDGKRPLSPNEFHQMAGRAGRRGIDTKGYCLPLSCNNAQRKLFEDLKASNSNDLESNFKFDFAFTANYLAAFDNQDKLKDIISQTLYGYTNKYLRGELLKQFEKMEEILINQGFVDSKNKLTQKGELLKHISGYEQVPVINLIYSKKLDDLNPIELATVVSSLANVVYNDNSKHPLKPYSIENESPKVTALTEKISEDLKEYRTSAGEICPHTEIGINPETVNHVYEWAKLNGFNQDDSRQNWHDLCSGEQKESVRDEGSLFKEIALTADLMKQMCEICETGKKYDTGYYTKLQKTLEEAIGLILREPVNTDKF